MKNNILFFGPKEPPITGQSVCFQTVLNNYKKIHKCHVINTQKFKNPLVNFIYCSFFSFIILFKKFDLIYMTGSRRPFGIFKELTLIYFGYLTNTPIINHIHGFGLEKIFNSNSFINKLMKFFLLKIQRFIFLHESMVEGINNFQNKFSIVNNFYSKELDIVNKKKENQIIYLSNIIYSKGIIHFLKSLDPFLLNNNKWNVVIAGNFIGDEYYDKVLIKKKFYQEYNPLKKKYKNRIKYLGTVVGKEKSNLLFKSKIFILPTFYKPEAFPLSIIESMRAKCYIITTKHNYLPKIVNEDNGSLIMPKNINSIYNSLNKISNDNKKLRLKSNYNQELAKKKYSEENYLNSLAKIFNIYL